MRYLAAIAALLYSTTATPEMALTAWWQAGVFGAPCSTKTDLIEGTCKIVVRKVRWK